MGDAKRRKKLDPNYGFGRKNILEIEVVDSLIPELSDFITNTWEQIGAKSGHQSYDIVKITKGDLQILGIAHYYHRNHKIYSEFILNRKDKGVLTQGDIDLLSKTLSERKLKNADGVIWVE